MEIRAYHHGQDVVELAMVEALGDAQLARVPLEKLYHMAADLDYQAASLGGDCQALWVALIERGRFLDYVAGHEDGSGFYAALVEEQRIDRHNWELGRRLLREFEAQQARVQLRLSQLRGGVGWLLRF
jgi:hypothetical protein